MARAALALFVSVFAAGCMSSGSLHPLFTTEDREFDTGLLGVWRTDDSSSSVTLTRVTRANGVEYHISLEDSEHKRSAYVGHLLRLDGRFVMDVAPDKDVLSDSLDDTYKALLLPLHQFVFVEHTDSTVTTMLLEPDSLERYLSAHPRATSYALPDSDTVVLTAPTPELRSFIAAYARRRHVFGEPGVWRRAGG